MQKINVDEIEAIHKRNAELALIREFAGRALTGYCANVETFDCRASEQATWAFDNADAMLAEYKKRYGVE